MSLYHYTTISASKSIEKDGVIYSSVKGEGGRGVYLTTLTWHALDDTFKAKLRLSGISKANARFKFDLGHVMSTGKLEILGNPNDKQFIFRGDIKLDNIGPVSID